MHSWPGEQWPALNTFILLWEEMDLCFGIGGSGIKGTKPSTQAPTGETTTRLLTAGLLDAWWTRLVHLAGGITMQQQVDYWKSVIDSNYSGPAGLIEMKGWEHPSHQWDLPRATSTHPATSAGQTLATPAAPAPLWPPGLSCALSGCFFCVVSCQHTHFQWKPPHQEYIWGRHVCSQMHSKTKLLLVQKDRHLPWSSWNARWDKSCKLPTKSNCYAAKLWLWGCAFTPGPSRVQMDLDAWSVLALPQGWMTFRSLFQPLFSMMLW